MNLPWKAHAAEQAPKASRFSCYIRAMECRGRLWEGLQSRKRTRGMGNQESHAEGLISSSPVFLSHSHPMLPTLLEGMAMPVLGKGGSPGGGRAWGKGTALKQDLGDLVSCKDRKIVPRRWGLVQSRASV